MSISPQFMNGNMVKFRPPPLVTHLHSRHWYYSAVQFLARGVACDEQRVSVYHSCVYHGMLTNMQYHRGWSLIDRGVVQCPGPKAAAPARSG